MNKGKFCSECGKPKPTDNSQWGCSNCGQTGNIGAFCQNCGKPRL